MAEVENAKPKTEEIGMWKNFPFLEVGRGGRVVV